MIKMKNNKGFAIIETLLIFLIIGIIGGTGWYVWNASNKTNDNLTNATKANSSVPKYNKKSSANNSVTVIPTSKAVKPCPNQDGWSYASSAKGKFSLCYPKSWVQPVNEDGCDASITERSVHLGPDSNSVLVCGSENFGQMWVGSDEGDKRSVYDFGSNYKNVIKKSVTVDGVAGSRISAVAGPKPDSDYFGPSEGTIEVHYVFYTNGITYSAGYRQAPAGQTPSRDVLSDFDLMITKHLNFSN